MTPQDLITAAADWTADKSRITDQAVALTAANTARSQAEAERDAAIVSRDSAVSARDAAKAELAAHMATHDPITPPPPPVSAKPVRTDRSKIWLGASVDQVGSQSRATSLAQQETRWGRKNILTHYYLSGSEWPAADIQADVDAGRIPILSVKFDASWTKVAGGTLDPIIKQHAQRVKALGKPVMSCFHHEPTNDGGTGADFIAQWKHCVDVFRQESVTNAAFLWIQISYDLRVGGPADAYFPGASYVDFIGADPYNWPPKPGASWLPFSQIVQHAVKYARAKGIDLIIAETGTNEKAGDAQGKATWFKDMLAYLKTSDADIIAGISYFDNIHTNTDSGITNDWRTNSSTAASAAWKILATDPKMSAGL